MGNRRTTLTMPAVVAISLCLNGLSLEAWGLLEAVFGADMQFLAPI